MPQIWATSPEVSGTVASQSDPISTEKISTLAGVIGARMKAAATTVRAEVDLRQKVLLR